jgi:eukaryotic translation initiation factor 2C
VRQSFFHNNPSNFVDLGGGVMGCRGFHSSFRATQSGLSLNIGMFLSSTMQNTIWVLCMQFGDVCLYYLIYADVSTTMIVKPGPVVDFLIANQKVDHPSKIDWAKVTLRAKHNTLYKNTG